MIEHVLDELAEQGGDRFDVEDLFEGRISVHSTVDARVQAIVNEVLEHGLARYEKRHPKEKGVIQGSVVVLGNADAAILAESGGRLVYEDHHARYSDYNAYRAIASGVLAEPRVIDRVTDAAGVGLYEAPRDTKVIRSAALRAIQEGLRGVVRLPDGTAHSLAGGDFPPPVMGKTGTTS